MKDIKLKATQSKYGPSHIDLIDDQYNSGTFAIVWADPDGSKGRELVKRWNEHEELVEILREVQVALATLIEPRNTGFSSSHIYYIVAASEAKARALLSKIGGAA